MRILLESLAIASALLSMLVLGFELGGVVRDARRPTSQPIGDAHSDIITRAQFESELRRVERGVERELLDQAEKWRTLAGRIDKRLAEPRRKPQDELAVDGEASSMGGKLRAREKARRLGLALPALVSSRHSPPSTESPTLD